MSFAEKFADKDLSRYQAYYQLKTTDPITKQETKTWYSVDLAQFLTQAPDLNVEVCDLAVRQDGVKDEDEDLIHGNGIYDLREQITTTYADLDDLKDRPTQLDLTIVLSYYHNEIENTKNALDSIQQELAKVTAAPGSAGADSAGSEDSNLTATLIKARQAYNGLLASQEEIFHTYDKMLWANYLIYFDEDVILKPIPSKAEATAAEERIKIKSAPKPKVVEQQESPKIIHPATLDETIAAGQIQPLPAAIFQAKLHDWYWWDKSQAMDEELSPELGKGPHHAKERAAIVAMKKYIKIFEDLLERFPEDQWVDCYFFSKYYFAN